MLCKSIYLLAALSIVLGTGGPVLARLQVIPSMLGLLFFVLSGLLGTIALVLGAIAALRFQAYLPAMVGAMGLLPLIALLATSIQGAQYPSINDITTNLEAPPPFVVAPTLSENQGRDMTFPAKFADAIRSHYSDMAPLEVPLSPELTYRRARDIASQPPFGWTITRDEADTLSFEAVAETKLFRWKDDIIVEVHGEGTTSRVEMRSKSREGKSDLGANARRIRRFFDELRKGTQ